MTKEIYIIKNLINGKIYIGQSVNSKHRWEQHVSASKHNPKCVIDQAIAKYGEKNFTMEILLKKVENYNEKEIELIEKYDCLVPKGYNVAIGGNGTAGIYASGSHFQTEEELEEVTDLIRNSKLNFETIASMYGCSQTIISAINVGKSYFREELEYPLREYFLTEEKFKQLAYSLKYELDKTLKDIAEEYSINIAHLSDINQGKVRWKSWLSYPLREGKIYNTGCREVREIIRLLAETNIPQKDIARQFNISTTTISGINTGINYKQPDIKYPIRKDYHACGPHKHTLSPNEVKEIEKLLAEGLSAIKIGEKFEVSASTIRNINNGKVKKYFNPNINYPIKKN